MEYGHRRGLQVSKCFKKKTIGLKIQQWYAKRIFLLSSENETIYETFIKVMKLVQPMTILMYPQILIRVLARTFFNR